MKVAVQLTGILLLSLVICCTRQTQSLQSAQKNEEGQSSIQPHKEAQAESSLPANAARGTPAEAKAMLQKVVEHYNSVGRKQALADFTGRKPPFFDRDLYVVCISPDRTITANGGFPQYVGYSSDMLKDADNELLGKAILDGVKSTDEASIQYRMINPVSRKVEPKVIFVQKVGDDVCGVGAYNPQ